MRRAVLALPLVFALACDSTSGRTPSNPGGTGATGVTGSTGGTSGGTTGGTSGGTSGGSTGGTTGGINLPGGNNNPNCGVQNFQLNKAATPDLLIVQDRSGSMNDDANDMPLSMPKDPSSKWMQIVGALEPVVQQITTIDWGLMMFGADTGACDAPTMPDVAVGKNTGAAIKTALDAATPSTATPTTATINNAVAYYKTVNDGNAHYLLLATDGEPNCAMDSGGIGGLPGFGGGPDDAAAEAAVSAAAQAGIHTFVVGIGGNTGADATLSQMAMNGMEPNMTSGQKPYYSVSTTNDLLTVLNKIAGQIVSCSYALQMPPTSPDLVEIQGNGAMTIPRDPTHMNGWDFGPSNMSIIFYGPACDQLQKGVITSVQAIYNCAPVG